MSTSQDLNDFGNGRRRAGPLVCLLLALSLAAPTAARATQQDERAIEYYQEAVELQKAGDIESAVIQLKNALQRDPDYGEARALLGELYVQLGDGASAEKELLAAAELGIPEERLWTHLGYAKLLQGRFDELLNDLERKPPAPEFETDAAILRGEALFGLRKPQEAADALGRATQLDPKNAQTYVRLAEILAALRQLRDAEAQVDRALEINPKLVRGLLLKGEIRRLDGDTEQAMASFDRALEAAPESVAARLGRITVLIDLSQDALAKNEIEALRARSVNHPMVEYLDAVILARQQEYKQAQNALMQIGPALDNYAPALLFRATLHYALNEFEQGRSLLGRLLKIDPTSLPATKLLAATQIKQGAADEAIQLLEATRERVPDDAQIMFLLGSAYLHVEDFDAATRSLEQALAMAPGNLRSVMQLAFGQIALGFLGESGGEAGAAGAEPKEGDQTLLSFLKGLAHLQAEEFDQAMALAETMIAGNPSNPLAVYLKGGALLGLGRLDDAQAAFETVAAEVPDFLPAQVNLARLQLRRGDNETAETLVAGLLEKNPANVEAMMLMAEVARRKGRDVDAVSWLETAMTKAPKKIEPRLAMISLRFDRGEVEQARKLAELTSVSFANDPRIQVLQAEIELRSGNTEAAMPILSRLIEMQPDVPLHRYRLAEAYASSGDRTLAKDQLLQIIDRDGRQYPAYLRLIDLELADGKGQSALGLVERLRGAYPEAPAVDQVEGRVQMYLGQPAAAAEAYERAWSKGQNGELAVGLYQARVAAGKEKAEAIVALGEWVGAHPEDAKSRMLLASELLTLGRSDEAMGHYEALLEAQPENPVLLNNLAWLYHEKQDERAVGYAERALAAAPSEAAIMDTLGWILLNRGELERAEGILETAAGQAPDDPDIVYHFAAALEQSGRDEEAKALLSRILMEHNAFPSASEAEALKAKLEAN